MDLTKRELFKTKNIVLRNSKTGEKKSFIFRPFMLGDEEDIIECITSEYGDTYFKRDFYNPDKLRAKAWGDDYQFFCAECDGKVRGIYVYAFFHEEDYIEVCSNIFHKSIRGFGLSERFTKYVIPLAKLLEPKCLFVHAVAFHPITQIAFEKNGFVPVGFRLGTFRMSVCKNSFNCERFHKQSEGVGILPVSKRDVGRVYVPEELVDFATEKYSELGVEYQLSSEKELITTKESAVSIHTDELQRMEIIRITEIGDDILPILEQRIASHTESEWVYQVIMPANNGAVIDAYDRLKDIGFFFTGLLPICGKCEHIYMQYVGDLDLQLEDYSLTPEFERVLDYITLLRRRKNEA